MRLGPSGAAFRRATKRGAIERLGAAGLRPGTVFDVGVYHGTPELYEVFDRARHVLVEPVRENEPLIWDALRGVRDARVEWVAASNRPGEEILSVSTNRMHSRIGRHAGFVWDPDLERAVTLARLDALRRDDDPAPFLIKVDVDGTDIEVLEGATGLFADTHAVIVESTTAQMADRIARLAGWGFALWDVVDLCYGEGVLYQADLVFVPERLMADGRFCPWAKDGLRGPLQTE